MSEMKCPICGGLLDFDCYEGVFGKEATLDCIPCGLTITGQKMLDRITAAMDHKRKWDSDSSLETWFPYTEDELVRLRNDLTRHNALREAVKKYFALLETNRMKCVDDMASVEYTAYYDQLTAARAEVDRLMEDAQ